MSKNKETLESFTEYCTNHPGERFWQALRNWCGYSFVGVTSDPVMWDEVHAVFKDTFYFEGRNK